MTIRPDTMTRIELHDRACTFVGDCRQAMRAAIAPASVHTVVTSPPYWGLRDYGIEPSDWEDGERCVYGLEATVEGYVRHTLEIFRGLDRVLRPDGVVWWNLGDTFASGAGKVGDSPGGGAQGDRWKGNRGTRGGSAKHAAGAMGPLTQPNRMPQSVADGNKLLIPYRVAIALQDAGWVIREDVIWSKPSPMPVSVNGVRWERCRVKVSNSKRTSYSRHAESQAGVNGPHSQRSGPAFADQSSRFTPCPGCDKCRSTDGWILRRGRWRTTTSHEVVLMVTRPGGYFCDAAAAAEQVSGGAHSRGKGTHPKGVEQSIGQTKQNGSFSAVVRETVETRNPRSVWRISSEPLKEKHFAAFPSALAWKCIQASTSAAGCCPACGACYAPQVTKERVPTRPGNATKVYTAADIILDPDSPYQSHAGTIAGNRDPQRHIQRTVVHGYRPTCACITTGPVPCVVYDPFAGSGTTLQVAAHSGRIGIGSEISAAYLDIQRRRVPTVPRCFQPKKQKVVKRPAARPAERFLFEHADASEVTP